MNTSFTLSGNIVDIVKQRIFKGTLKIKRGIIEEIREEPVRGNHFILPGLIDAHVHIESSLLIPSEFARLAVTHGTVAVVSDPHEIANVLGMEGVKYMIENASKTPFKIFFGAPSCVPATPFETSGALLGLAETEELLKRKDIKYLSEMMNFPGVISGDKLVMEKLALAKKYKKPVDGHAPALQGVNLQKYIRAGISTDHECTNVFEAQEKIKQGMKVLIREGSAAKNFETLISLLEHHAEMLMFCSDDKHPDDLLKGHINELIKRAIAKGFAPLKVLRSSIYNPVKHYNLEVGLLQKKDPADCIVVDNLNDFNILQTYIEGILVAENGKSLIAPVKSEKPNLFRAVFIKTAELELKAKANTIKVIEAIEGELLTNKLELPAKIRDGRVVSDVENDVLKMVVLNRYQPDSKPAIAFAKNFGLKNGAIASTIAHDSHNIIALGVDDEDIAEVINLIIENNGGIALTNGNKKHILPLPIAGIMSNENAGKVAWSYELLENEARKLGSSLKAPFMTLSFMALLVIPELKLSDKGLFDGNTFEFTAVF